MAKTCSYFSFRGSTLKLKGAFDQPRGIRATVSRNLVRQPRGAVSRLPAFTAHPASTPGPGTTSRGRSRGAVFGVGPKRTHTLGPWRRRPGVWVHLNENTPSAPPLLLSSSCSFRGPFFSSGGETECLGGTDAPGGTPSSENTARRVEEQEERDEGG